MLPLKMLIVEDEELELRALSTFVSEMEHVVVVGEARSGVEMLQLAQELHPDLMLVDIKIPGISGLEAVRQLREMQLETKAIIVTAYDEFCYAQEALELGAIDYLLKPVPKWQVQESVRRAAALICQERERREAARSALRTKLVLDVITGAEQDPEALRERTAAVGLKGVPTVAMVVDVDPGPVERRQVYDLVLSEASRMEDAVAALTGVGELVVLFRADLADPEDAVRMAEWIRTHLAGSGVASVTVGVGSPAPEPGLLQNSYRDAVKALRAGLYSLGGNRVLLFSEVAERFHDTVSLEHLRMENDLAHHVTRGDVEKATAAAETIFDGMISSGAGVAELRLRLTELITILSRAAVAGNVDPGIAITWSGRLKLEVQGCSTPDALRSLLRQAATTFAGMVADVYRPATTRMIQRAIDYMRERYAEPISVRDVAGMLYLNTSYFCRAFKQVTGRTFGEYLTELRMEKALELLHASDLSIAAVAREVGYRDANYFSRVFTRIMGKTPSRYRQELQRRTCLVG